MSDIFLYKHEAGINPQQLQKLRRAGYICVGVRYMDDAKVLEAPAPISQARMDLILRAACEGVLASDSIAPTAFGKALAKRLLAEPKP